MQIIYFLTILIHSLIAIYLLKNLTTGKYREGYLIFLILQLCLISWSLSLFLLPFSNYDITISRSVYIGPSLVPFLLVLFSQYFPYKKLSINKFIFFIIAIPVFIFLTIIPSSLFLTNIDYTTTPPSPVINSVMSLVFNLISYSYTLLAIILFIKRRQNETGIYKLQVDYLVVGISISVIGVFIINFLLPMIGIHEFRQASSFLFIIFDIFALITIQRTRLYSLYALFTQSIKILVLGILLYIIVFGIRLFQSKVLLIDFFSIASQLIDVIACISVAGFLLLYLDKFQYRIGVLVRDYSVNYDHFNRNIESILSNKSPNIKLDRSIELLMNNYFKNSRISINNNDLSMYTNGTIDDIFIFQETPSSEIRTKAIENNCAIICRLNDTTFLTLSFKNNNGAYNRNEIEFIQKIIKRLRVHYQTEELLVKTRNFNQLLQQKVTSQTQALQQAYDQLKKEDEGKNDILNIVSHQLLTPISIIRGEVEELREATDEKNRNVMLEKLALESKRSFEIVDEILRVSRVIQNGGYMVINKEEVDVIEMINQNIQAFKTKAETKGLKLHFVKPKGLSKLLFKLDREKINESLSNMIDNAINYTEKGEVTVTLINSPKRLEIKVKDTGIGIKKEDIGGLFNKFIRLENAKKVRPDGTGIGLYFVKLVMDAHKGSISATSEGEGKGSEFTLTIPS